MSDAQIPRKIDPKAFRQVEMVVKQVVPLFPHLAHSDAQLTRVHRKLGTPTDVCNAGIQRPTHPDAATPIVTTSTLVCRGTPTRKQSATPPTNAGRGLHISITDGNFVV